MFRVTTAPSLDHPLTLPDIATISIALVTIITLILNIVQTRRSNRRTVSQVNRQDRIRIYAISLAGFRATLSDLETNVANVKIYLQTQNSDGNVDAPLGEKRFAIDTSESIIRHDVINEVGSFEHQTQMELFASSEMYSRVLNWLIQFHTVKTEFDEVLSKIGKDLRTGESNQTTSTEVLEKAKAKVRKDTTKLSAKLDEILIAMKDELEVTK